MTDRPHDMEELAAEVRDFSEETLEVGGNRVPRWFRVVMSHPRWPAVAELHVTVGPDGPVATGISLHRKSTKLVPYTTLHDHFTRTVNGKALGFFLRWATAYAVQAKMADEFAALRLTPDAVPIPPEAAREEIERAMGGVLAAVEPRRRRFITSELLAEVADVYRAAMKDGRPPTVAVKEHFRTTHSTAARWVREARQRGHLGPAQGPKPGEAKP